jgi:hypothetical protein
MWTVRSEDQMNSSHVASHNFYRNSAEVYCIVRHYASHNRTYVTFFESIADEPALPSEFPFEFLHQI